MELSSEKKWNLFKVAMVMFLLLFSYPLVRSTTTAIFLSVHGAKASPYAWTYSIILLGIAISLYNKFQVKYSIHRLYGITTFISALFFVIAPYFFKNESFLPYPLFIWKEVYIVLLVHSALGYLNSSISGSLAKIVYGPLGALGSLGGILGGLSTKYLTQSYSVESILIFGAVIIFLSIFLFSSTDHSVNLGQKEESKESPLHSILGIKKYVFLIGLLVFLTQYCINFSNFLFNIGLGEFFPEKIQKTSFLGGFYSAVNAISLVIQVLIVPFALRAFSLIKIHHSIALMHIGLFLAFLAFGSMGMMPLAISFAMFKGVDYSIFSTAKEMLYFRLTDRQKYGAKYIVDMVVYRLSKGLVSVFLIFINEPTTVKILLLGGLVAWFILAFPLGREYKKLESLS